MSITDKIKPMQHKEVATAILSIQKSAIEMASFGAKKRIDIWMQEVDEYTLDYLSAYFGATIQKEDKNYNTAPYVLIRSEHSDIYVQLKQE